MQKKVVLIIGTGTIGEPLISLFAKLKDQLGVDEVYFHKNTPLLSDKTKVVELLRQGAKLCVASDEKALAFKDIGLDPDCLIDEALNKAAVVIDCTPSGVGTNNKEKFYEAYTHNTRGFIAQGSEEGFGKPYAYMINDGIDFEDQFIQIVSCNTHNMAALVKTLTDGDVTALDHANFVCIRRATDISQFTHFIAAPTVAIHSDQEFGTHHARDVSRLLATITSGVVPRIFSSAIKIPTQYMHIVQFRFKLKDPRGITLEEAKVRIKSNPLIAITEKLDTGTAFSFARDHSPLCGRILNQAIVPLSTLHVEGPYIMGYSFTPQDGNSLLSSVVAAERFLYPDSYREKIECLNSLVFEEV